MAQTHTLAAESRKIFGKKLKRARSAGRLPIVVYGPKEKSRSYFVETADFLKVWTNAGESSIISLVADGEEKDVLIHDVELDPIDDTPRHADLYAIEKDKLLRVKVPLGFFGNAPAVKSLGGVLVKVLHEVEIEALPRNLPHSISVDISSIDSFERHITVGELKLPESVRIVFPHSDEIVVLVAPPKEEEKETQPVDLSKIEVEKKGKKPEDEVSEAGSEKS